MMNKITKSLAFSLLILSTGVYATSVDKIIGFGDSLSDTGNNGPRFSDGPLWPEVLAQKLNLPIPQSSNLGGLNFSYSGAMSGSDHSSETVHVGNQIKAYLDLNDGKADPDALYLVWIGGNDFLDKRSPFDLIENISSHIETLIAAGATQFFVPNLPSLIHAPKGEEMIKEMVDALLVYLPDSFEPIISPIIKQCVHEGICLYNQLLKNRLRKIELASDIVIYHLDVFSIFNKILEDPESHGFSSKSELFYDSLHPNAKGHELIADSASKVFESYKPRGSSNKT